MSAPDELKRDRNAAFISGAFLRGNPFPPKGFRKFWWLGLLTVVVAIVAIAILWQNMPNIW
jgi:hypothetical protein